MSMSDFELEQIRRRDELLDPIRYRTQAELDRRALLSEVASLRSQLRWITGAAVLHGEQRAEWERRRVGAYQATVPGDADDN